jgi:hypothetical protein
MVRRDFTLRYKQTFVGAGWAVLQPLGLTLVLALFFDGSCRTPSPAAVRVFMLPAMVVWQFFSKALSMAGVSLRELRRRDEGVLPASSCRSPGHRRARRPALRAAAARSSCSSTSAARAGRWCSPLFIAVAIAAASGSVYFAAFGAVPGLPPALRSCCSSGSSQLPSSTRRRTSRALPVALLPEPDGGCGGGLPVVAARGCSGPAGERSCDVGRGRPGDAPRWYFRRAEGGIVDIL